MNLYDLPVHPAADIFPMLCTADLQTMAQDIQERGLVVPLLISAKDGKYECLIDGRNRRAAWKIAYGDTPDKNPPIDIFEGDDVEAHILALNLQRRHMGKGPQAMVVAKMFPDTEQGKRSTSVLNTEVSNGYLSHARTVLKYNTDDADLVIEGKLSLNDAYETAQLNKKLQATNITLYNQLSPTFTAKKAFEQLAKTKEATQVENRKFENTLTDVLQGICYLSIKGNLTDQARSVGMTKLPITDIRACKDGVEHLMNFLNRGI